MLLIMTMNPKLLKKKESADMSNYEYQFEIFWMMKSIYPIEQLNDCEEYLKKLWKMDNSKLKQTYELWKEITFNGEIA